MRRAFLSIKIHQLHKNYECFERNRNLKAIHSNIGAAHPKQFAAISPADAVLPNPMFPCKNSTATPVKLRPKKIKIGCIFGKAPRARNDTPK